MYMTQSSETSQQILALNTRLSMARYIRNYLANASSQNQLLPANSGIENPAIEQQIAEYNTTQLRRNDLVANSSEKNPLVADMDQSLKDMRQAIIASVDNHITALDTQLRSFLRSERQTTERIAANPTQGKYLLSVERQQTVKEALYLFLLQKREENELSQAFTAYNTRVITPPTGNSTPTAPVRKTSFGGHRPGYPDTRGHHIHPREHEHQGARTQGFGKPVPSLRGRSAPGVCRPAEA